MGSGDQDLLGIVGPVRLQVVWRLHLGDVTLLPGSVLVLSESEAQALQTGHPGAFQAVESPPGLHRLMTVRERY